MILTRKVYERPAPVVARDLLGTFLVHRTRKGVTVGRIVETEAYLSADDAASHSHRGKTPRNAAMFGPAGHGYVYFIYGMYYCFNVVTGQEGVGEAVLIRAVEPVQGLELMKARRGRTDVHTLCNGPGKLAIALGIEKKHNGAPLTRGPLHILSRDSFPRLYPPEEPISVVQTTRIGISLDAHLPLRYYIRDNPFVSRRG